MSSVQTFDAFFAKTVIASEESGSLVDVSADRARHVNFVGIVGVLEVF